jgi:hypothetical protein
MQSLNPIQWTDLQLLCQVPIFLIQNATTFIQKNTIRVFSSSTSNYLTCCISVLKSQEEVEKGLRVENWQRWKDGLANRKKWWTQGGTGQFFELQVHALKPADRLKMCSLILWHPKFLYPVYMGPKLVTNRFILIRCTPPHPSSLTADCRYTIYGYISQIFK